MGCTPGQAGVGRNGSTGYDTKPSINDYQVDVVVGQAHTKTWAGLILNNSAQNLER